MNHQQVKEKRTGFIEKVRKYERKYKTLSLFGAIFSLSILVLLIKIQASENTSNQQFQFDRATVKIMRTIYTPGCAVTSVNGIKTRSTINKNDTVLNHSMLLDNKKRTNPRACSFLKNKTPANLSRFNIRLSLSTEDLFVS